MDSFAANSKKSFHVRSNSLPSKPHPVVDEINENLCRLRASEEATSSSSSLCQKLDGLQDLQDSIDKLLLLPLTHQALVDNKSVDELLEGSLKILDVCALAKDVLSQMKESVSLDNFSGRIAPKLPLVGSRSDMPTFEQQSHKGGKEPFENRKLIGHWEEEDSHAFACVKRQSFPSRRRHGSVLSR